MRRTWSDSVTTLCPITRAVPVEGDRKVDRMRSVVVLPAPFEPMNPNRSPLFTVRSRALSAVSLP